MPIPLQISFRNMDPSPAVEERIRQKAAKLERFHDRIVGCTVVVEAPHRHHHKGKLYNVRVDISVPGKDVVVDRAKPTDHARCCTWRTSRTNKAREFQSIRAMNPLAG